jgi:hypothetical protein
MSVGNAIMNTMNTPVEDRLIILAELEAQIESYPEMVDWIVWHNISVPIATLISMGIFQRNSVADTYINSGFDRLLKHLGKEDLGYKHIEDLFDK